MRTVHIAILGCVLWLSSLTNGQSCDAYTVEQDCVNKQLTGDACQWVNGLCKCKSEVKLDILFNVDTSGSIGASGFQIQKQFISTLVTQGINNGSRIGFFMFAKTVNASREIQFWDEDELANYASGLYWTEGYTNTPDVLQASITEFDRSFDQERAQILMMITDGNPCLPESQGGCPQSVCNFAAQVSLNNIRVIIIGVGDGLETKYVKCLTQSDDDFIPVASFSTEDFNSIMGSLSGVLCPINKAAKFTEIKPAKKESSAWGYRWSRFVEIYNTGVDFSLNEIALSGLVSMDLGDGPTVTLAQGQYVVFYDAADDSIVTDESVVTCHLCPSTCTLSNCAFAGDVNAGYCWCENSIYVACGNTNDPGNCPSNARTSDNGESAENACSVCTFNDNMDRYDWSVELSDNALVIDTVDYDTLYSSGLFTNINPLDDGFAYELISKGFENDVGSNWLQTCSVFGTPGSDPVSTCDEGCTVDGCGAGNTCSTTTQLCVCDTTLGYYPICTGNSCTKCGQVYPPDNCIVTWYKTFNYTGTEQIDRYAIYTWDENDNAGQTESYYQLTYFSGSAGGDGNSVDQPVNINPNYPDAKLTETIYITSDFWNQNFSIGGYVETAKEVCTGDNEDICEVYYSQKTYCTVVTPNPSPAPTREPTPAPVPAPTRQPTPAPTWPCPQVYWQNDEVCDPEGDLGSRCICSAQDLDNEPEGDGCCLITTGSLPAIFDGSEPIDTDREHRISDDCKLDTQLQDPDLRGESGAGTSPGYLLTETEHGFSFGIAPTGYPFTMEICWALTFDEVSCRLDNDKAENTEYCDGSVQLASVGLNVSATSGCLTVDGAAGAATAVVTFEVSGLTCDEAAEILAGADGDDATNTTRRRRLQDSDERICFDNTAIYGNLRITSLTTEQDKEGGCFDGRIYPMDIPVWYNYADAFVAAPTQEEEIPPWLWWLIGAMVVFLAILAALLYKFWWKNKATGAALGAVQSDLDAAIEENEMGFGGGVGGNAVGFNPLATGFNPNAPAGAAGPNGPLAGQGGGGDFVRPNVEKEVFRQEYGQNMGQTR